MIDGSTGMAALHGAQELTLDEMLADSIVQAVMARDGVTEDAIRSLIRTLVAELKPEAATPPNPTSGPPGTSRSRPA